MKKCLLLDIEENQYIVNWLESYELEFLSLVSYLNNIIDNEIQYNYILINSNNHLNIFHINYLIKPFCLEKIFIFDVKMFKIVQEIAIKTPLSITKTTYSNTKYLRNIYFHFDKNKDENTMYWIDIVFNFDLYNVNNMIITTQSIADCIILLTLAKEIVSNFKFIILSIDSRFFDFFHHELKEFDNYMLVDFRTKVPYDSSFNLLPTLVLRKIMRRAKEYYLNYVADYNKLYSNKDEVYINTFILPFLDKKKVVGLSLHTSSNRKYNSFPFDLILDFIKKNKDTYFINISHKYNESEIYNKFSSLKLENIIDIDTDFISFDIVRANKLLNKLDYAITVDNSSLYQLGLSKTHTYSLVYENEKSYKKEEINEKNQLLLFKNVTLFKFSNPAFIRKKAIELLNFIEN
jgi:hypothetical protein